MGQRIQIKLTAAVRILHKVGYWEQTQPLFLKYNALQFWGPVKLKNYAIYVQSKKPSITTQHTKNNVLEQLQIVLV